MKGEKKIGAKVRLLDYLEFKQIKKPEFYRKTGLSNGFLDKNENINSDKIEIISSIYSDLNLYWLLTGKGEMIISKMEPLVANLPPEAEKIYKDIISEQKAEITALNRRIWELEK